MKNYKGVELGKKKLIIQENFSKYREVYQAKGKV
jgi:hypothetical protein